MPVNCEECLYEKRIEKLEDKVGELEKTTAVTSDRYNTILSLVNGLTVDVKSLLNSGGKKWDNFKWIIVACIVSTVLGSLITATMPLILK